MSVEYTEADDVFAAYDQRLPHGCYTEDVDGNLWVIIAGSGAVYEVHVGEAIDIVNKTARQLNDELGVSPIQANAMRCGVKHGWDSEMATVEYWEKQANG